MRYSSLALLSPVLLGVGTISGCTPSPEPTAQPTLMTLAPVPAPPAVLVDIQRTRAVPTTIDSTGLVDVSEELQGFLDQIPDGTTVTFPGEGEYLLSRGLTLDGRRDLVLDGNGATLLGVGCGADASVFDIGRGGPSEGIVIREFEIVGDNTLAGTGDAYQPECEHTHGVSIRQSSEIEIVEVSIRSVHGDCVYVGGGGFERSERVHFHDSSCRLAGRQGIAITAGDRVHVENVDFDEIAIIAFDIEPNEATEGARDVVFTGNTVGTTGVSDSYSPMFFGANGNLDAEVRNVTVSNNIVTGSAMITLVGDEDKGWSGGRNHYDITVVGNSSPVAYEGPVMTFKHVDGLTVYGNEQPLLSGPLVRLEDTVNVDIR